MSGAFFSSDEARSHGFGKKDGGNRGVGYAERAVLWQEVLGDGTEFKFKEDILFKSQEATFSATNLQSAVCSEMQQRDYFCNVPCSVQGKRHDAIPTHPPFAGPAASLTLTTL